MDKFIQDNESKNFTINKINRIKIKLASANTIKDWGSRTIITYYEFRYNNVLKKYSFANTLFGEVITPEISFSRRLKERFTKKGLFSEEIFGPINSFKCYCKIQTPIFKDCELCGITNTFSKIRSYRFGYIPLALPVFNSLIFLGSSNIVKVLFNLPQESFTDFIYFTFPLNIYYKFVEKTEKAFKAHKNYYNFVDMEHIAVQYRQRQINKTETELSEVLTEFDRFLDKYIQTTKRKFNNLIVERKLFNEEIYNFLNNYDFEKEIRFIITTILHKNSNKTHYNFLSKKLRILENFYKSNMTMSSLMFKTLPVIPPYYRPYDSEDIDGSKSSLFNSIYQYILQINEKLGKIIKSKLPNKIYLLLIELRTLQESVDFLIDHNKIQKKNLINERPSKSFADIIKGKTGRFRKNILGKRINFSARSVIVVNPLLRMTQCALPLNILTNLFSSKINNILDKFKFGRNGLVKIKEYLHFAILKKLIKHEVVLLNRAPTLHKLGLQTFNIILTNSDAIQLHPLVCSAYNADFDGDQMAVYLPLTKLSYIEYNSMLKTTKELFLFGNSNLKMKPSQELILGLNYLTMKNELIKHFAFGNYFVDYDDFFSCLTHKRINIHSVLWIKSQLLNLKKSNSSICSKSNYIRSTAGRVLLNKIFKKII